jgi:hypothetical protein
MPHIHYQSTRTRERDPSESDYFSRPLVRRNSKRQHVDIFDDDEYDDYPHHSSKPSRALVVPQPTQLEKYNVWSHPKYSEKDHHHQHHHHHHHSDDEDDGMDRTIRYKYTHVHPSTHHHHHSDDESDREREFRLKIRATFGRPKSSQSSSHKAMAWPSELFKRREKFEDVDWESRERQRVGGWWDEQEPQLKEKTIRFRRVKRTKTEEWVPTKPLKGWRRV